jgi:hypothetical protein
VLRQFILNTPKSINALDDAKLALLRPKLAVRVLS